MNEIVFWGCAVMIVVMAIFYAQWRIRRWICETTKRHKWRNGVCRRCGQRFWEA